MTLETLVNKYQIDHKYAEVHVIEDGNYLGKKFITVIKLLDLYRKGLVRQTKQTIVVEL